MQHKNNRKRLDGLTFVVKNRCIFYAVARVPAFLSLQTQETPPEVLPGEGTAT